MGAGPCETFLEVSEPISWSGSFQNGSVGKQCWKSRLGHIRWSLAHWLKNLG